MLSPVVRERLDRLKAAAGRAREKARELTTVATETLETTGTAGVIGYLETKRETEGKPHLEVFGMELETFIGLAAHAAALTGAARGQEDHLRAVGNGGLAVMGYKKGRELGMPRLPGGAGQ